MDPLSLTAGILAVLGAASQTAKVLRAICGLRHAPREILELVNEVVLNFWLFEDVADMFQ